MDEIKVILADGTELYFPAGTDDAIIDARVKEVVSGQSQEPVATERQEPIGLGGQAALGATQSAFDAMSADSGRGAKMGDIFDATLTGEQSLSEGVMQAGGQGVGYLGDLIGQGVAKLGEGVSYITPDVLEDEVMNQLGIFFDQPMMQMGKRALQAGGEAWENFSQENPRAARNIEAIVNISGVGLGGGAVGPKAAKSVSRMELPSTRRAREAQESIEQGGMAATRNETAPFRMVETEREPFGPQRALDSDQEAALPVEYSPVRRAVKNPAQEAAIKQGFDQGLIAMIREASPTDRRNMLRSLEIMEQATGNKKFSMLNRTTDVAGESIYDRYKVVRDVNERAGSGIDEYAEKNLKNVAVDFTVPVQNFQDSLEKLGVKFNDDLTLDFEGSVIEGVVPAERILNQVVKRMRAKRNITAYDVHNLKRFIDEQVNYGKAAEGLSGKTINTIKALRRELDGVLDNKFPEYDRLNTTYAETIDAMNNFGTAIGRTINLDSPSAADSIGISLQGISSNIKSQGRLKDSVAELDSIASRYKKFDDDVVAQTAFTIDLDRMFGTKADTSLAGRLGEALATAPTSKGQFMDAAARAAYNKLRGVNQEKQFEAMRNLLKSFNDAN